jgi:sirohydrochlorin cobaltochelatase
MPQTGPKTGPQQHAVILIGHGSLRNASGASMIRIAARLCERDVAPVVEAAFLNYSRPTLVETVAKVVAAGVTNITVQPYFLIAGVYVQNDLRALVKEVNEQFPSITFQLAPVLGDHAALTDLAQRRVADALEAIGCRRDLSFRGVCDEESPSARQPTEGIPRSGALWARNDSPALLLMAHGTPLPAANAPLYALADSLVQRLGLANARVAYLDCNTPAIPAGIEELVAAGAQRIIAFPYFLHMGRHVAEDLPELIAAAQTKHATTAIHLAHHLDYDLGLVDAVQRLLPLATPLAAPLPAVTF